MASQFRTALVGLGVLAVCVAMASLKGHHLLMAFAGASLLCALRSWYLVRKTDTTKTTTPDLTTQARRTRTAEHHKSTAKVLQFPAPAAWNVSDARGS